MKKHVKLPTILGILILISGLIAGVLSINSKQIFKLGAQAESKPSNVRVSNITDSSLSITWTTDVKSSGFVKWGKSNSSINKVAIEDTSTKHFVHSVNISNIDIDSNIYFLINSDNKDYDNSGIAWQAKTLSQRVETKKQLIASGTILLTDALTPAKAVVNLSINGLFLSSITSDEGTWIVPISSYVDQASDNTSVEITVNAGSLGSSQAVIYLNAITAVPTMVLGKTYDFRSIVLNTSKNLPESSLSIPESVNISSRFIIDSTETKTDTGTLTIESVDNGEIINTTNPEFFGKAPAKAEIELQVESELQTATINADNKGNWAWNPPKDLEPGEHKVTLKWRDASGILRTVTRSFVVSASEGPAFESTPSATPIITATMTPTSSPSATPTVIKTPTTTLPPTPETGNLTPTVGLFIMGIGILLSSIFMWNKSYAKN